MKHKVKNPPILPKTIWDLLNNYNGKYAGKTLLVRHFRLKIYANLLTTHKIFLPTIA